MSRDNPSTREEIQAYLDGDITLSGFASWIGEHGAAGDDELAAAVEAELYARTRSLYPEDEDAFKTALRLLIAT